MFVTIAISLNEVASVHQQAVLCRNTTFSEQFGPFRKLPAIVGIYDVPTARFLENSFTAIVYVNVYIPYA